MHATIWVLADTPYVPDLCVETGVVPYNFDYARWDKGALARLLRELGKFPDANMLAKGSRKTRSLDPELRSSLALSSKVQRTTNSSLLMATLSPRVQPSLCMLWATLPGKRLRSCSS